jgi:hypothetical protein
MSQTEKINEPSSRKDSFINSSENTQTPLSTVKGVFANDDTEFERIREERQREVDRLSLELLSNSKHYKKYIAKNHPEEGLKRADSNRQFLKYKSRVAALFIELLDEYEDLGDTSLVGTELQNIFKECVQKTIQHLEWTEYNHNMDSAAFEDDEMMFSNSSHRNKRKAKPSASSAADPFSYWGATIRKSDAQVSNEEEP